MAAWGMSEEKKIPATMNSLENIPVNLNSQNTKKAKSHPANAVFEKPMFSDIEIGQDVVIDIPSETISEPRNSDADEIHPILILSPKELRMHAPYMSYQRSDAGNSSTFPEQSPSMHGFGKCMDFMFPLFFISHLLAAIFLFLVAKMGIRSLLLPTIVLSSISLLSCLIRLSSMIIMAFI
ncbi:hypothetical protein TNCT_567941 [Trichonephila clavata]|uniref:Transmembrane protein n=1 Tax=Trichonephila clavata TaxID=2740835 RepID=A0A8X6KXS6_TRICU|nr:hypothetical protein TNCT_567941 [Trichonephila clavata]